MILLRRYIREILASSLGTSSLVSEITKLPKKYFSIIDNEVKASNFWKQSNHVDDIDAEITPDESGSLQTPAANALQTALRNAFQKVDLDADIFVSSHDDDGSEFALLHDEHPAYPNRWLRNATWYISKQKPGRSTIDLVLMAADDSVDINDVDTAALVRHITQTIRHELVHYFQMKKQAKSRGLNDTETFQKMLDDPKQVPPSGPDWERKYLEAHIEVDAHAHDGAEELLAVYGKERALEIIRKNPDLSDPKLPNAVRHYFEKLSPDNKALQSFRIKLYQYLQDMSGDE
ncbi:MAG: hypothetical protein CME70_14000 [Halobacteriovorax sp.]|nr:hypothetical protein [Halobacteriovorax sp.]|tara:strand:- start:818 stop:1687 length:870 start_codon:yes stop_codon:yes gene_type:complete